MSLTHTIVLEFHIGKEFQPMKIHHGRGFQYVSTMFSAKIPIAASLPGPCGSKFKWHVIKFACTPGWSDVVSIAVLRQIDKDKSVVSDWSPWPKQTHVVWKSPEWL